MRARFETPVLVLLALVPLWVPGPFPTYDGPQHVLSGWLLNHIADPGTPFSRYLELQTAYSALFCPVLVSFFERLLPIRWAIKGAVSVSFVLQAWAYLRMLKAMGTPRSPFRWFAPALPWLFVFYMGFLNYYGALGFAFVSLALLFEQIVALRRGETLGRRRWFLISGMMLLTALSHAFASVLMGLVAGCLVIGCLPWRRLPRALGVLFLCALPRLALQLLVAGAAGDVQGGSFATVLAFSWDSLASLPENMYATPYGPLHVGNALVGVGALASLWALVSGNRLAAGPLLAIAAIVLLTAFIPNTIRAWSQLNVRFTPFLALLSLSGAALALPADRRVNIGLSAVAGAAMLATLVATFSANSRLADLQAEFESGIGQVEAGVRRVYFRNGAAYQATPDRHMASNLHVYYMIEESAMHRLVFRNRREAHVLRETERWTEMEPAMPSHLWHTLPEPANFQAQSRYGLYYDEVLLWAPTDAHLNAFLEDGYAIRFHNNRLYRLEPPRRQLRVEATLDRPRPLFVNVRFSDLLWPYSEAVLKLTERAPLTVGAELGLLPAREVQVEILEAERGELVPVTTRQVDLSQESGLLRIDLRPPAE